MTLVKHLAAALLVASLCTAARAERPTEDPGTADCVVTARVEKVFLRQDGRLREYVVQLWVEQVHPAPGGGEPRGRKGRGDDGTAAPKRGEMLFVYTFQTDPSPTPETGARGHDAVPKERQRVKAYVRRRHGGTLEGNYPHWFDAAPREERDGKAGDGKAATR